MTEGPNFELLTKWDFAKIWAVLIAAFALSILFGFGIKWAVDEFDAARGAVVETVE